MAAVRKSIIIAAPAEKVWATVRDFGRIDRYVPAIERSEADGSEAGATRTLTLQDGAQVEEQLKEVNDEERTLRYTIVQSPLPISDYVSTMKVRDASNGQCEVQWACTVEPNGASEADVKKIFSDLYEMGLQGLDEMHAA